MDLLVFYGEFIYIVSKYEKERAMLDERWDNDRLNSLKESVDIMKHATELLLRGGTAGYEETEPIADFINRNVGKIFDRLFFNMHSLIDITHMSGETKQTVDMIDKSLASIQNELDSKKQGYKERAFGLLETLQNLADML